MPEIFINGHPVQAESGQTVLQAALANGFFIPYFCWHPALSVAGNCRICVVQVEGRSWAEISCNVRDLAQRPARRRDDDFARRRQRGEPLALAHEHRQPELVLELADLLADAGLRREQRFGRVGHVEAVVDDRAHVLELLQVHRVITRPCTFRCII